MSTYVVFSLVCAWTVIGVVATALRLPGTWMILFGGLFYGWWTEWEVIPVWLAVVLAITALVAEMLEMLTSVVSAKRAGASNRAAWGGLIGAFAGMIFLSFLLPIPLIGTIFGALVGCFLGALLGELSLNKRLDEGTRIGISAAVGFVIGLVIKLGFAATMAGVLITVAAARLPDDAPTATDDASIADSAHETVPELTEPEVSTPEG